LGLIQLIREFTVSEVEEDLKATAEAITADARRLLAIEEAKLVLDPRDPMVPVLSAESQEISKRLVVQTEVEDELAATLADSLPD
jgi:hypothetical protein